MTSEPTIAVFTTKPQPPKEFRVDGDQIIFTKSESSTVRSYKLRYRNSEEDGTKTEEIIIPSSSESDTMSVKMSGLTSKVPYRVNITAIVEDQLSNNVAESKALHEKVVASKDGSLSIYKEEEND